ncbi:MAG: hypothetical protein R6U41_02205 [Desulfosalsimonas sp.]|uniref:DUF6909 family protein n=1 Tax=Desulfosalsimonas sp. TaxID=3073848 RepID=UPI0039709B5C
MTLESNTYMDYSLADKSRLAIRTFKTIADAALLRGYYRMGGRTGSTLESALRTLSPEIYGSISDSRTIELKGLEYVIDRLPRGIEACHRIVMTGRQDAADASFERIQPLKRRRISFRISPTEMSFVITRGQSEIYDIMTHITFLHVEAKKVQSKMRDDYGNITTEWRELEKHADCIDDICGRDLDQALWNLSLLLGRTFDETKDTYANLEKSRSQSNSNSGLFQIVHSMGKCVDEEVQSLDNAVTVHFPPSLSAQILNRTHARNWAANIKKSLCDIGLEKRPLHIISANQHSVVNLLYGYAAVGQKERVADDPDLYDFIRIVRDQTAQVEAFAKKHGCHMLPDDSGSQIDCRIIDAPAMARLPRHPAIALDADYIEKQQPVILVMDYAFGEQAFEILDELLYPWEQSGEQCALNAKSVSVIGKAGILPGQKGDIMLATAHVLEGTPHNYMICNDLTEADFDDDSVQIYTGPIITVLGTSLQNRYVLKKFQDSSWKAVGLEMEGGHFQRAINAAFIRGHVSSDLKVMYAYYASDNPLKSGQTLASGSMGEEGIKPTYLVTRLILEKIMGR